MTPNVQQQPPERGEPIRLAANLINPGDRIAKGFLPAGVNDAEVLFTYVYERNECTWVLVIAVIDGLPEPYYFLAEKEIPVYPAADPDHGRTTAVAEAKPDTLVVPLGHAADSQFFCSVCAAGPSTFDEISRHQADRHGAIG